MKNVLIMYFLLLSCMTFSQSACLEFDGDDNYISTSSASLDDIDTGDFTLMAWVQGLEANQTTHPMILSNRETAGPGCLFFFHDNFGGSQFKLLSLQLDGHNYFLQNEQANLNILDGQDHQVVISKGNGIVSFYSDGILIGTRNVLQEPTTQTFHNIWIGKDEPTNNTFDGNLYNISIWNKVLSPEEINIYTCSESIVNEDGLVAFWPLNEGTGQEVVDLTNGEIGFLGGSEIEESTDPNWNSSCAIILCTFEICNDGIDNDGDGLIDCEDDDCYLNNSQECISCLGSSQTFADVVLSYNPVCPENHDPIVSNPQNAIGSPNYVLPVFPAAFGTGFVSLGEGGSIELGFVDNILVNSGDSDSDLYVFEVGTDIESMMVDLRPINTQTIDILIANGYSDLDLDGYYEIATIAGATSSLDLDALIPGQAFGILKFDAIILTDVLNTTGCLGSSGADIDAVCALTSMAAEICDNDIDDDGDGLVDCDDPDIANDCCCLMAATLELGEDQEICPGEPITITAEGNFISYLWSDQSTGSTLTVTSEGTYWLEAIDECDNLVLDSIEITLDNAIFITENAEICDGQSIEINGEVYDSEGIYEQTLEGNGACDTTLTITIIAGETVEVTESFTINSGESIEQNGETFTESGIYIQNLSTMNGCDSIVTIIVSVVQNIVHYDFEDCLSNKDGEGTIYTEFAATYPDPLSCGTVQASNVYRENPTVNGHSCTEGVNESIAMCVSSQVSCDYETDSEVAVRFEIDITPENGSVVQLNELSFYEKSPVIFNWIDGGSGPNYYPTLYGIRILLDNQVIYQEDNVDATEEWSLEQYDLSEVVSAQITSNSELAVELTAYCTDGSVSNITAWDIDEINLSATCIPANINRMIAGAVNSANGIVVENVKVKRASVENPNYQYVDENGHYAFESDVNTDYILSADKIDQKMKGVSTKDLILIQNHLLGFAEFEHAYQYIAADINSSDHISGIDIVTLRKLILGVTEDYPNDKSWAFVEPSEGGDYPWSISEQLEVSKGFENSMENNLVAIKIGDVSDILDSQLDENQLETRSDNTIKLEATLVDNKDNSNATSQLDFYAKNLKDIHGFQLAINLNGIEVKDLTSEVIDLTINNYHITNDQLIISWSNINSVSTTKEPLFTVIGEISKSQIYTLSLSESMLNNEAYIGNEYKEQKIELTTQRSFKGASALSVQIHPNPMTNSSNIIVESPKDGMANIQIIDISGRIISQEDIMLTEGSNSITYSRSQFGDSGLYCILINQGSELTMNKLVVQ